MNKLYWYDIDRMVLPDILFSVDISELKSKPPSELNDTFGPVTIGYSRSPKETDYAQPSLILLDDLKAAETISWINAHSPESFPFSQFGRTVTKQDYKLARTLLDNDGQQSKTEVWPSVIIGEILALGDSETPLESLPLSRAQATFTNAVARSYINYKNSMLHGLCIERLSKLENNPRFVGRTIHVAELSSVWAQVIQEKNSDLTLKDLIDNPYLNFRGEDLFGSHYGSSVNLRNYQNLLSASAEDRILEYRKLLKEIDISQVKQNPSDIFSVAAAAFLVGRSTSHLFLLKEIGRIVPTLYLWFGYIAGMMGPKYWTLEWSRASKGIEKGLRATFSWEDLPQCDLSWTEYEWLDKAYKGKDPFIEIPKLLPKVLSLELVPGASCQLRLSLSQGHQEIIAPKPQTDESDKLRSALKEFVALADRLRDSVTVESQTAKVKITVKRVNRSNQRTDNVKKMESVTKKNTRQKKTDTQ